MLVNSQGKSKLESELCGGPWAVDMSYMLFSPHVYHVMQFELSQYFKIIQGWPTVTWSSTMELECPFILDVELHCVVKCGILEVTQMQDMDDRWVQKQFNKFK